MHFQRSTDSCSACSAKLNDYRSSPLHSLHTTQRDQVDAPLGPLDPLNVALQRVRELELELAQTKLAHVEAECKNQDLNHQLNTTMTEIQGNSRNNSSWQPWLSKTINSIQEKVATRRETPTFQSYTGSVPPEPLQPLSGAGSGHVSSTTTGQPQSIQSGAPAQVRISDRL